MKTMRKIFFSLVATALAASCFAPIRIPKPAGAVEMREATPQEMEQHQQLSKTMGNVGVVPDKTEDRTLPVSQSDPSGQSVLAKAEKSLKPDEATGREVLAVAEDQIKEKESSSPVKTGAWGLLFLAAGFGCVYGLKHWANKHMPENVSTPDPQDKVVW